MADPALFDEAMVGPWGAGYEWHVNEGDLGRYSLAAPPLAGLTLVDSEADLLEGGQDRRGDNDEEEDSEEGEKEGLRCFVVGSRCWVVRGVAEGIMTCSWPHV